MDKKTFSLTSDKKVLIVESNGVEVPYIPANVVKQVENLQKQKADQVARFDAQIAAGQIIIDEYNKLIQGA